MSSNILSQKQVRKSITFDDTLSSGDSLQSLAVSLEDDLNAHKESCEKRHDQTDREVAQIRTKTGWLAGSIAVIITGLVAAFKYLLGVK